MPSAREWPPWQKTLTVAIVAAFAFLCTFAASIIAPGREKLQAQLGISRTVSVLPFCVFNLGLAWGPVVGSPVSERYGRRPVFQCCMTGLLISVMACGFSEHSLAGILICRFLGGLCGSAGVTLASATVSDLYEPGLQRGTAMFTYYSMPWVGAVFGPLVGYLVVAENNWPWTQWVYLFVAVPIVVPGLLLLRETKQSVLQRRASATEKASQPISQKRLTDSRREKLSGMGKTVQEVLLRPLQMLFDEPIVGLVCLYAGFNFGLIYALIVVFPDVFSKTYGFDYTQRGLPFLGLIVGCIVGPVSLMLDNYYVQAWTSSRQDPTDADGQPTTPDKLLPEIRLHGAMLGGLLVPVGLLWFAWTARQEIKYLSPIFASVLITWGSLGVYASTSAYLIDTYGPRYGASANAANSIVRYTMAGVIPVFILQMYDGLGTAWATSLLALCALLLMPIPWCFYRWGPALRARCKFETES